MTETENQSPKTLRDELSQSDIDAAVHDYIDSWERKGISGEKARDFAAAITKRRTFNLGLVTGGVIGNLALGALALATGGTLGAVIGGGMAFTLFLALPMTLIFSDGGYAHAVGNGLARRLRAGQPVDRGLFKSDNLAAITLGGFATGLTCANVFMGVPVALAIVAAKLVEGFVARHEKILNRLGRDVKRMLPDFAKKPKAGKPVKGTVLKLPEAAKQTPATTATTIIVTPPKAVMTPRNPAP